MKKIFLIAALLITSLSFAQQEVKLDIADALVFKTIEVSYEQYLSDISSVGISVLFNFEKKGSDLKYNEKRMFTPFYRHYFSSERQWNMFGEAFLGINSGEKELITNNVITGYQDYTDGAIGVAVGTKYVADNGLVIDIYAGVGRNLFGSNSPIIVPRAGVNVGYRF
ncbi:uncharacterized protein DUF3575 [Lutibacter sp. Hel_I_33_5]|uniref:DUF3575 domain-containing protein n=1 Tax=Lutibacter sp. Hel_I_33_5 TaxID=1566289 RepID=UPI0011A825E2|nr:DUF3575 domain-containing protein [Lutibacter sp. Hel_I_33_5]TVZ55966.1 uncharacterized protein DUF3575 [Lutibacter sp. Hel_I_33_5]